MTNMSMNGLPSPSAWFWRIAAMVWLAWACMFSPAVAARDQTWEAPAAVSEVPEVSLARLPPEAAQTLALIKRGGPFPYPGKDGSIFGNFEKRLPIQPRGYYREYTVPTPGLRHRGARRIIAGQRQEGHGYGRRGGRNDAGEYYYTGNHYRSFRRIREP